MSLTDILVHLDGSERSVARLRFARALAGLHDATVTGLYAVTPALLAVPLAGIDGTAVVPQIVALDAERRDRARARFDEEARSAGSVLRWIDGSATAPHPALRRAALVSDLVVMGQQDPDDDTAGFLPADLVPTTVMDSGRPVLLLPRVGDAVPAPRRMLLAWKPTREAARAATAALPWLRMADRVDLVADLAADFDDERWPGSAQVERWLRAQGVRATLEVHHLDAEASLRVGERLLETAVRVGAHWLVMGCYGHSRAREWVLGGATRAVLRQARLPVLMVH